MLKALPVNLQKNTLTDGINDNDFNTLNQTQIESFTMFKCLYLLSILLHLVLLCSLALPWGDPEEAAGSPLNGAQWHLKYCC